MTSRRTWLQAALGALAAQAMPGTAAAAPQAGLPRLARGLNLAHWFEYERTQALDGAELQGLARLGLDHVRLPLDPLACGWRAETPRALPFLVDLTRALDLAQAAGLATVLDLHLAPEQKAVFEGNAERERALAELWSALAGALRHRPVNALAFELFNEPQYYGLQRLRWPGVQRQLLAAVRAQAPSHLVLLSGARGGSLEGLQALAPEPDGCTAYTFHYYEPFVFTHQGLPWLDERYTSAGTRRNVLYPAALNRQQAPTVLRPHPRGEREWADYLAQDWRAEVVARAFVDAAAWGRQNGVPVLCNEFGTIRAQVDPASRYRWLKDVRLAAETNGIGWTVWEYTDIFGLTRQSAQPGQAGRRELDAAAYDALGLQRPRTAG